MSDQEIILRQVERANNYNAWLLSRAWPYLHGRVLEVGAGMGTFTLGLASQCESLVALEPERELAAVLRERVKGEARVTVMEKAIQGAKLPKGGFEVAVCFNVLEHIQDEGEALGAIWRALKIGGRLLLLVPAHPSLYGGIDEVVEHVRRYRQRELQERLVEAGFEIEESRYVHPLGAAGWFFSSRLLRYRTIPEGGVWMDRLVPLIKPLDRLHLPFGLSLWSVAVKPKTTRKRSASEGTR